MSNDHSSRHHSIFKENPNTGKLDIKASMVSYFPEKFLEIMKLDKVSPEDIAKSLKYDENFS